MRVPAVQDWPLFAKAPAAAPIAALSRLASAKTKIVLLVGTLTLGVASRAAGRVINLREKAVQGVVFRGGRQLEILKFEDPTPGPGEVVI